MKKLKYFIPATCLMILIFYMSHQPANDSMQTSNFIVDILKNILNLSNTYNDLLSTIVRKGAHMGEYALLAIFLLYGLYHTYRNKPIFVIAFISTVIYACTDEFHQLFIVGRSGQFSDILVDSSGAFIGLLITYSIYKIYNRNKEVKK